MSNNTQINTILEKILITAGNGSKHITVNEYINKPIQNQLKKKGYQIIELGGVYTIKW